MAKRIGSPKAVAASRVAKRAGNGSVGASAARGTAGRGRTAKRGVASAATGRTRAGGGATVTKRGVRSGGAAATARRTGAKRTAATKARATARTTAAEPVRQRPRSGATAAGRRTRRSGSALVAAGAARVAGMTTRRGTTGSRSLDPEKSRRAGTMARPPEGAAVSGSVRAQRAARTTAVTGRAAPVAKADARADLRARDLTRGADTESVRGSGKSGMAEGKGHRGIGVRGHGGGGGRAGSSGRGAKGGGRGGRSSRN